MAAHRTATQIIQFGTQLMQASRRVGCGSERRFTRGRLQPIDYALWSEPGPPSLPRSTAASSKSANRFRLVRAEASRRPRPMRSEAGWPGVPSTTAACPWLSRDGPRRADGLQTRPLDRIITAGPRLWRSRWSLRCRRVAGKAITMEAVIPHAAVPARGPRLLWACRMRPFPSFPGGPDEGDIRSRSGKEGIVMARLRRCSGPARPATGTDR
jgi:hypothetical protein